MLSWGPHWGFRGRLCTSKVGRMCTSEVGRLCTLLLCDFVIVSLQHDSSCCCFFFTSSHNSSLCGFFPHISVCFFVFRLAFRAFSSFSSSVVPPLTQLHPSSLTQRTQLISHNSSHSTLLTQLNSLKSCRGT